MKDVKIKSVIFAAVIMAIIWIMAFSAQCINIDGRQGNAEWSDSELHFLEVPDDFGNDVKFAYVRIVTVPEENKIFLCIGIEYGNINDPNLAGATVSVCGGAEIYLSADGTYRCTDDSYAVKTAASRYDYSKNAVIEAEIVKARLASRGNLKLRIIDTYGKSSNLYTVDFGEAVESRSDKNATEKSSASKKTKEAATEKRGTSARAGNDFTYKLAESVKNTVLQSGEGKTRQSLTDENGSVLTDDFTAVPPSRSEENKKLYIVLGSVSAVAVATSAVLGYIRKEKVSAAKQNKNQDE